MDNNFLKIEKNISILNNYDNKNIDKMTKIYKKTNEILLETETNLKKLKKKFEKESKKIIKIKNNNELIEFINKFEEISNRITKKELSLEDNIKLNNELTLIYNSINYFIKNKEQSVKVVN